MNMPRNARILLAEDHRMSQEALRELLNGAGLITDLAANGQTALDLALQRPYDLILMDVDMPVMGGLAATIAIRALPEGEHIPILAMSATRDVDDHRACIDAGMNDCLTKPVAAEQLFGALERWLPNTRPAAKAADKAAPHNPGFAGFDPELAVLSDIPGLDIETGLANLVGRIPSYLRVLRHYAQAHQNDIERLHQHLDRGETDDAQRLAHSLKGASGALGMHTIQNLAASVETAIRQNAARDTLNRCIAALGDAESAMISAIQSRLPGEPAAPAAPPIDVRQAQHAVDELTHLLDTDDIRAGEVLRHHLPLFNAAMGERHIARLRRQIEDFAYEDALTTLAILRAQTP